MLDGAAGREVRLHLLHRVHARGVHRGAGGGQEADAVHSRARRQEPRVRHRLRGLLHRRQAVRVVRPRNPKL